MKPAVLLAIVLIVAGAYLYLRPAKSPTFKSTDDMMVWLANEAVDIAKRKGITLDYSEASVENAEDALGKLHDDFIASGKNTTGQVGLGLAFGAYLGEVIKRNLKVGRWERDDALQGKNTYPFIWPDNSHSYLSGWCHKRIIDGPEENVLNKYFVITGDERKKLGLPPAQWPHVAHPGSEHQVVVKYSATIKKPGTADPKAH